MKRIARSSLTEIVYEKLKRHIVTGKLALGQQIVDTEIAELLCVSKTPVREALLKLKADGLVEIRPRSGTYVFLFTVDDLKELTTARFLLERDTLRIAYQQNPSRLIRDLSHNIEKSFALLRDNNLAGYLNLDQEFHSIFFANAGNRYLEAAYQALFAKISALRHRLVFSFAFVEQSINSHSIIVEYIVGEDIERACGRLSEHINKTFTEESLRYLTTGPQ